MLANGTTATTQTAGDNSTKVATTAYVDSGSGVTHTIASGALALATSAIASAACQTITAGSVNSVAATGVLITDSITYTPNGSIKAVTGYVPSTSGGLTITGYPTAGYVNFDVCNWSGGSITPGTVTLNWKVTR